MSIILVGTGKRALVSGTPTAPISDTITSVALATDGVTLALLLAAPATITGSATITVNGTARSITWTTPGVSSATKIGTLASPANQGDTVLISAPVGFLTPALAAAVVNATVTNSSTVGAATPAGASTSITSATLAADGVTLTLVLSQAATLTAGSYSLVNGVIDTITWANPTTALTTRTGTLATAANQGDAVRLSVVASFTNPALAADASIVVTNNSTVVPSPTQSGTVDTTPTLLASFAGPAGTKPTGTNAISSTGIFIDNASAVSTLDGNGNYVLAAGAPIETLTTESVVPDGVIRITLASPGKLGLAPRMTSQNNSADAYFVAVDGNGNAFMGTIANGGYTGVLVTGNHMPDAKIWDMNISGTGIEIVADGQSILKVNDARLPSAGYFGFRSITSTPAVVSKIEFLTLAQAKAAQAAAALAAAQAKIGTPTDAGVYGEATPADNLPRGIYGPGTINAAFGMATAGLTYGSYFVRGMPGVTRCTLTGDTAGFYLSPGNVLTSDTSLFTQAVGTVHRLNVVFDNSLSGGTDTLTLPVTYTVVDSAVLGYTGGIFYCDGQDDPSINGGNIPLNGGATADSNIASCSIVGADAGLFAYGYYKPVQYVGNPASAHYGKHTVQFSDGSRTTPAVDLYVLGPQSPRVKLNYASVWDNSDPGDTVFRVAGSSELGGFSYTAYGPAADFFTVGLDGTGTLKAGVSLAGKGGQAITGVLRVVSHGVSTYVPISVPVAAGTVLPAGNMTAAIATNLKNWATDPNNTRRRAVTPTVSGMPGPVTWSLTQNNICYEDADPNSPYGLRHHRYVQNADGSVDALAQLSTQTDTLTLKARSGGTVCIQSFDVVVTSVPETIIYIGRGMRAAHGAVGFDHMGEAMDLHKNGQSGWQFPHFMLMGDDDPTYYDNDVGQSRYSLPGPTTWEGVKSAGGHYPRCGGFWNTGKYGGIATGEKGFIVVNEGDHIFKNIEFSHVFGSGWQGFGQPHSTGGMAIRQDGNSRGNLTVDNCFFHDIDQPMEVGASTGNVTITNSTFENYTGAYQGSGAMHGNYIGNCWRLTVDNCFYHRGWNGHLLKCRAWHSTITRTRLYDGTSGGASNQIDLCDAGIAEVAHCVLHAFRKQNFASLQFGEEMRSGSRGKNRLNSHDNLFISNYPANISQTAISARTIIDPVTGDQGQAFSTNDTFYGYGPATPNHIPNRYNGYDYNPNYTYGTIPDVSAFNQPFPLVNPTYLSAQPALDYSYAHNFQGFSTKPGPGYYPYSGEGSAKGWFNIDGVLVMPGVSELSVAATANGTVVDTPTVTGCLEADMDPTQPSIHKNPFADGNNTWQLRTDIQSYLGAAFTYPVAPAGMFTINAQTGALTYNGGAAAGTTQYVGRECKNNTNGTVAWDYQYIRVTA